MKRQIFIFALTIAGLLALPNGAMAQSLGAMPTPTPDPQIWVLLIVGFAMTALGLRRNGRSLRAV